jgi:hypothetical protein
MNPVSRAGQFVQLVQRGTDQFGLFLVLRGNKHGRRPGLDIHAGLVPEIPDILVPGTEKFTGALGILEMKCK